MGELYYLRESGLLKKLTDQGFKLLWASANNEATSVNLLTSLRGLLIDEDTA